MDRGMSPEYQWDSTRMLQISTYRAMRSKLMGHKVSTSAFRLSIAAICGYGATAGMIFDGRRIRRWSIWCLFDERANWWLLAVKGLSRVVRFEVERTHKRSRPRGVPCLRDEWGKDKKEARNVGVEKVSKEPKKWEHCCSDRKERWLRQVGWRG